MNIPSLKRRLDALNRLTPDDHEAVTAIQRIIVGADGQPTGVVLRREVKSR